MAGITTLAAVISFLPSESENSFLQTEQVQYSAFPASVQVAAFASVLVRVCAAMGSVTSVTSVVQSASENILLQTLHCQYSILPVAVQVGSTRS